MPAITYKVEVEFVPGSGSYTDISSRVEKVTLARPRPGIGGAGLATTFDILLQNDPVRTAEVGTMGITSAHVGFCPFSPDSPAGPWWPNVTRDRRVRITALWNAGANSKVRAFGWSTVWTPDAGQTPPATAMTTLSGGDILNRYAQRRVLSVYGETAIQPAGDTNTDYYPFDDETDSTVLRGVDSGAGTVHPGTIIQPILLPGSAVLAPPDGGHLTDGQIEFTRGDNNSPAPVVLIPLRSTLNLKLINAWFRLNNDPKGSTGDVALAGYGADGALLWTWGPKLVSVDHVQWTMADSAGTTMSSFDTGAPRDEGWHFWSLQFTSATATAIFTANKGESTLRGYGSGVWAEDTRKTAWLVVGGQMVPSLKGRQTNTLLGSISSLMLQFGNAYDYFHFGNPGVVEAADNVTGYLNATTTVVDALVGGSVTATPDATKTMYTNVSRDLLTRWNEITQTVGGGLIVQPSGKREYLNAAGMRLPTVALTLNAEQDLSAPDGGWVGTKDERPTRITVTSPLGSFLIVNTASEAASGLRLEGPNVPTSAGAEGVARSVAGLLLSGGGQARMVFGVDLTTTATDKISSAMDLKQTQRVRITNLPSALLGLTQQDVYASGWTETYEAADGSVRFQFDTDPADDPPEAVYDDAEYGRFGLGNTAGVLPTVTGGTCVGTTATGTVILTAAAGAGVLTTVGGSYTLDLDWNGERITLSGVGGGTSPQTATVTARGVAPTVARAHVAGEPVDVWRSWTWSP